jgi:hypothetical protein
MVDNDPVREASGLHFKFEIRQPTLNAEQVQSEMSDFEPEIRDLFNFAISRLPEWSAKDVVTGTCEGASWPGFE